MITLQNPCFEKYVQNDFLTSQGQIGNYKTVVLHSGDPLKMECGLLEASPPCCLFLNKSSKVLKLNESKQDMAKMTWLHSKTGSSVEGQLKPSLSFLEDLGMCSVLFHSSEWLEPGQSAEGPAPSVIFEHHTSNPSCVSTFWCKMVSSTNLGSFWIREVWPKTSLFQGWSWFQNISAHI